MKKLTLSFIVFVLLMVNTMCYAATEDEIVDNPESTEAQEVISIEDSETEVILEDENNSISIDAKDVIGNNYIIIIFAILLLAIILIEGKKGIKVIIQLFITIAVTYFVLIKGIFSGHNIILMTILASAIIISSNAIIAVGFNKRAVTIGLRKFEWYYY